MFASVRTLVTALCLVLSASTVAAAPVPQTTTLTADLGGEGGGTTAAGWPIWGAVW